MGRWFKELLRARCHAAEASLQAQCHPVDEPCYRLSVTRLSPASTLMSLSLPPEAPAAPSTEQRAGPPAWSQLSSPRLFSVAPNHANSFRPLGTTPVSSTAGDYPPHSLCSQGSPQERPLG